MYELFYGSSVGNVEASQAARLGWLRLLICDVFQKYIAAFGFSFNVLISSYYLIMPPLIGVIGVPVLLQKLLWLVMLRNMPE